ncbi:hypothetical protein QQF64_019956, partial [Cirrhinus molitorella]
VFADLNHVKSVKEGDSVTLESGVTKLQTEDVITWRFKGAVIAYVNNEAGIFNTSPGDAVGFRDRLKLDHQTGSLTITNTRATDSGLYYVTINSGKGNTYNVTVY